MITKFKQLYTFTVPKFELVEESQPAKNDKGEDITITKKITKEIQHEFCLKKPSNFLRDEADMYYSVTVSQGIDKGLMSWALLEKRFANDGGIYSKDERSEGGKKYVERAELHKKFVALESKENKTEEESKELEDIKAEIKLINEELQEFERKEHSLYSITAEAKARTKTLIWWLLFLLHKKDGNDWKPFFEGENDDITASFASKRDRYDEIEEEEDESVRDFNLEIISKAMSGLALWYYGHASKQEDFEKLLAELS